MSVRVPPKGTRGTRFPRFISGLFSGLQARQFRRSGMRTQAGVPTLLLETSGARSGNPAWLHNLASRPDATIEFTGSRRVEVRAESLEGGELEAAWERIGRDAPEYVKYLSQTDRQIAVIRLRQRG